MATSRSLIGIDWDQCEIQNRAATSISASHTATKRMPGDPRAPDDRACFPAARGRPGQPRPPKHMIFHLNLAPLVSATPVCQAYESSPSGAPCALGSTPMKATSKIPDFSSQSATPPLAPPPCGTLSFIALPQLPDLCLPSLHRGHANPVLGL